MFGRRLFLACAAAALIATTTACNGSSDDNPTAPTPPPPQGPAELQLTDLVVGEGAETVNGSTILLVYAVYLYDPNGTDSKGRQFAGSPANGQPESFTVGDTRLITGFSQALIGMRVGGKRRAIIPPSLAWGSTGRSPDVRPNEWVVFEFDLRAVGV